MALAWFPRKLLAIVILVGQFKMDRIPERHSFEGTSDEQRSDQNCMSIGSMSLVSYPSLQVKETECIPEGFESQGMFTELRRCGSGLSPDAHQATWLWFIYPWTIT